MTIHPLTQARLATFSDAQRAMDDFVAARGWYREGCSKPQAPRNLAASICLEASEVLECFQWTEQADPDEVGAELADVVLYAAQLANVLGIDLAAAVSQKFARNEGRWAPLPESEQQRLAS